MFRCSLTDWSLRDLVMIWSQNSWTDRTVFDVVMNMRICFYLLVFLILDIFLRVSGRITDCSLCVIFILDADISDSLCLDQNSSAGSLNSCDLQKHLLHFASLSKLSVWPTAAEASWSSLSHVALNKLTAPVSFCFCGSSCCGPHESRKQCGATHRDAAGWDSWRQ